MGFRLVPKSVTLNDLERGMSLILRYFAEFGSFGPITSNWLISHQQILSREMHPLAYLSVLFAIAELLVDIQMPEKI